eukprot:s57_g70.t1
MLGNHVLKEHSLACYSRDMLSKPLRDLAGSCTTSKQGSSTPDGTRSGWMASQQLEVRLDKAKEQIVEEDQGAESVVPSPSIVAEEDVSLNKNFDPSNPFQEPKMHWEDEDGASRQ